MYKDMDLQTFGEAGSKIYDDWEGIGEVTSIPDHAPHRTVDKIIIAADGTNVRTAIVCPPTIYGVGRGPGNGRGHQLYELARCTLEKKSGLMIGSGYTYWTNVHVYDMSNVYLRLVEAAAKGGGKATWGKEGYYFTENGEHVWGEVSEKVAATAHQQGFISSDDVVAISGQEANQMTRAGELLWGANSRCRALRARRLLGWTPRERAMNDEIADAVKSEAKRLGLVVGHAAQVAG